MNAAVVTVGDELVLGEKSDSNFPWLARRLAELGISCALHETVGDDQIAIARAIKTTQAVANIVVVSGGLGPTSDDVTREGVARALGRELVFDDVLAGRLCARFPQADRQFLDLVLNQAYVVQKAEVIVPRLGTAPGMVLFDGDQALYVLPGVSAELEEMFDTEVVEHIGRHFGEREPLVRLVLRTAGLREAEIEGAVGDLKIVYGNVRLGYLPRLGQVDVTLTGKASERAEIVAAAGEIRERLGNAVFGEGEERLEAVVGRMLKERKLTLSVAESCTGGLVGKLVTDVPGSSEYFSGSVVCYSNEAKTALLGIDAETIAGHGAVSEIVAVEMADGVRDRLGTDLGIGVTGVAGPGGGTERTPVGAVYLALAHACGNRLVKLSLAGGREQIRLEAAVGALNEIRLHLEGLG
ncbi:MAG: competence/damage-inducible protein A [Actinobacteria bacterium]|nr:MAG: competence/damage-inducible protein A [Actinomycetota bacterium]